MEPAEPIVTLETYSNAALAGLAKSRLDAYGIPCFLSGETVGALYPFTVDTFSGIRLQVFERDAEQAKQLLSEGE
ncbi:MAG: putative signal transducing protein [Bacteroidota bacterium]